MFGMEDSAKKQRCEDSFPSREIGYNEKRRGCSETDVITARESKEHLRAGNTTLKSSNLKLKSNSDRESTTKSTNLNNFQAKRFFFEHYIKKGEIFDNVTGHLPRPDL